MEELLLSLNGPWSNAACIGYCAMAMRNAGLSEKTQRKVLDELTRCFDDVSVEDCCSGKMPAAHAAYGLHQPRCIRWPAAQPLHGISKYRLHNFQTKRTGWGKE